MKKILTLTASLLLCASAIAAENRLFENRYNALPDKQTVFKVGGEWFPYPEYTDRKGWDELLKGYKKKLIKRAETFLDYNWQPLEPSRFLEFEQTGDRRLMNPEQRNRSADNAPLSGKYEFTVTR